MAKQRSYSVKPKLERVAVVSLLLPGSGASKAVDPLQEISGLVEAAGAQVVGGLTQRLSKVNARSAIGKGKIEELKQMAKALNADFVVIDHNLTPSQGRNLEADLEMRVVDRTELILDIFASRAQTKQAKLQVELAQLEYMKTRLKRMWTHLERTEGAIGSRGPGETQLETDRRLVAKKITYLKNQLKLIESRRHREAISREYPYTISLVGYTNAGKSSMLKLLTSSNAYVADQLFATLDTKVRYWRLLDGRKVVLADTVGFVRELPHHLVASFHATLEETINSDLLLHLIDAADPDLHLNIEAVNYVLSQLDAQGIPQIFVFNKIDKIDKEKLFELQNIFPEAIFVSAATGLNIEGLDARIAKLLDDWSLRFQLKIPAIEGKLIADINDSSLVLSEQYDESCWNANISIAPRHWQRLVPRIQGASGEYSLEQ
jgi:GTP-binding protein HflX